jgi:hypothetical protein
MAVKKGIIPDMQDVIVSRLVIDDYSRVKNSYEADKSAEKSNKLKLKG